MQTKIVMVLLTIISFWLGQVYLTIIVEKRITQIYKIFKGDEVTRDDYLINIGVKAVYELLFKREPPI